MTDSFRYCSKIYTFIIVDRRYEQNWENSYDLLNTEKIKQSFSITTDSKVSKDKLIITLGC